MVANRTCLLTILSLLSLSAFADYSVVPTYVISNIKGSQEVQELIIKNRGKEIIKLEPSVLSSENNPIVTFSTAPEATSSLKQQDISPYITFSPKLVNLPGDKTRTIRYRVKLPQDLPNGTYFGKIKITMQSPTINPIQSKNTGDDSIHVNLIPIINTIIPIWVQKGQPTNLNADITVSCTYSGNELKELFTNTGKWLREIKAPSSNLSTLLDLRINPWSTTTYTIKLDPDKMAHPTIQWHYKNEANTHTVTCQQSASSAAS